MPNVSRWARDPRLTAKLAFLKMPGVASLVARQVAGMTPEQLVARQLARATPHPGRIPVEAVDATVEETRATRGADGGRGAQRAQFRAILDVVALLARPAEWREQLAGIAAPTLWLHGTDARSPVSRPRVRWSRAARSRGSGPEDVGHLPHLEDPAWTVQSIEEWLDHQVKSP